MAYTYDPENIFAKILRGEIPNQTVAETDHTLAFRDINPLAPVHVLVIPKGAYVTVDDFSANASAEELSDFWQTFAKIVADEGLKSDGYRVISNAGMNGAQDVPHFHLHVLGGIRLGPMLPR